MSSMGGGWKFIEEEVFQNEEHHTPNTPTDTKK